MAPRQVDVTIKGKDETKGAFDSAKKNAGGFGASITSLLNPLNLLKGAVAGVGLATLGSLLKSSVESAAGADAAWGKLAQAVENLGLNSEQLRPQLDGVAAGIQKTTRFADDAVQGALARLINTSGDYAGSLKNIGLVTDLAVAKNMDLDQAAELVGKVMTGNDAILKRYGITVADGTDAIAAMREQFHGFAERDGQSMQGALAQIANGWDNVKEAIGRAVLGDGAKPGMQAFADLLNKLGTWIDDHSGDIQVFVSQIGQLATNIGTLAEKAKTLAEGPFGALLRLELKPASFLWKLLTRGGEPPVQFDAATQASIDAAEGLLRNGPVIQTRKPNTVGGDERAAKPKIYGHIRLSDKDRPEKAGRSLADDILDNEATIALRQALPDVEAMNDALVSDAVKQYGEEFKATFDEMAASIEEVTEGMQTFGDKVKEVAEVAIYNFAETWGEAVDSIVQGTQSLGAAIVKSIRGAIAGAVRAKGQEAMLDAAAAAAKGLTNPVEFVKAAKLFAVGSGYFALASALGGGGGGGGHGAGGLSSGGFSSAQSEVGKDGPVTVVLNGRKTSFDWNDPDDLDAFKKMIQQLSGTRQVNFVFGDAA